MNRRALFRFLAAAPIGLPAAISAAALVPGPLVTVVIVKTVEWKQTTISATPHYDPVFIDEQARAA